MTSMQRWTATSAFAMVLIPMAFADPRAPPPGVTGTYETATAPVQSIYTVTEGSHRFVAYVVEWKGAPVVVSDALALSDYKVGDTITLYGAQNDHRQTGAGGCFVVVHLA